MTTPTPSMHPPPQNTQLPHSTMLQHTVTSSLNSQRDSETSLPATSTTLNLLHSYTKHLPPTQTVHPQRGVLPQPSEEAIQLAHRIRELISCLSKR